MVSRVAKEAIDAERRFAILGVLLQALHVLFGVTAILGMYLTLGRIKTLHNPLWREHCQWQLKTFWIGAILYTLSIIIGLWSGHWWAFILAAMWVTFRIASSAIGIATMRPPRTW